MWTNNHLKKLSKYRKLDNKMRMVEELTEALKIKKKMEHLLTKVNFNSEIQTCKR
jgi:hypothetical protein